MSFGARTWRSGRAPAPELSPSPLAQSRHWPGPALTQYLEQPGVVPGLVPIGEPTRTRTLGYVAHVNTTLMGTSSAVMQPSRSAPAPPCFQASPFRRSDRLSLAACSADPPGKLHGCMKRGFAYVPHAPTAFQSSRPGTPIRLAQCSRYLGNREGSASGNNPGCGALAAARCRSWACASNRGAGKDADTCRSRS